MPDFDPAQDASNSILGRQAFARLLGNPKVFGAAFLPPERAEWRGDTYTLGKALAKAPKSLFTGVRLQPADRRNLDQSRERAVQQDLVNLIRSVALFRTNPAMRGVVLSREHLRGRDPSGVRRVQFGLSRPSDNSFVDEGAAAKECHDQIARAIRGAGLRVASAPPFDPTQGFGGLEAWAGGLKLRQSKLASAASWSKVAAVAGAIGFSVWMVPSVAAGISATFAGVRGYLFPALETVSDVKASDGVFIDKVELTWAATPKATGYSIFRDDLKTRIAYVWGGDKVRYEDFAAPVGKQMKYSVQATTLFTAGERGYGDDGFRNVRPPEGVSASDCTKTDCVDVNWNAVAHATGYEVFREDGEIAQSRVGIGFQCVTAADGLLVVYVMPGSPADRAGLLPGDHVTRVGDQSLRGIRFEEAMQAMQAPEGQDVTLAVARGESAVHDMAIQTGRFDILRQIRAGATADTSFRDVQAPAGKRCRYVVRATTAAGASFPSHPPAPGMRCPPRPDGLAASDGTDTSCVQVRWNQVEGAESYEIERVCPDGSCQPAPPERVRGTSYADKTAEPGQTYAYRVKAVCPDKVSDASDPDEGWRGFVKPVAKASDGDFTDRVQVTWNAVPGARGYEVLRDDSPKPLGVTDGNATTKFEDLTAKPHVKHAYRVKAVTARADVPTGDADSGWRSLPPPMAVKASRGDTEKVVIEWEPTTGVDKYQVLRDKQVIHTTANDTDRRFEDRSAEIGRLYGYSVASVSDRTGGGPPSDAVDGYRNLKPPRDVTATADGTRIVVKWKAVEGATGYEVFRDDQDKDPVGFARGNDAVTWTDRQVPVGQFAYSVKARTDTVTGPPSNPTPPVTLAGPPPPNGKPTAEKPVESSDGGDASPQ